LAINVRFSIFWKEWKVNPHKAINYLIKNQDLGAKVERLISAGIL